MHDGDYGSRRGQVEEGGSGRATIEIIMQSHLS